MPDTFIIIIIIIRTASDTIASHYWYLIISVHPYKNCRKQAFVIVSFFTKGVTLDHQETEHLSTVTGIISKKQKKKKRPLVFTPSALSGPSQLPGWIKNGSLLNG